MCPHHTLAVLLGACVASASAAGDNTVIFQDFRLASGVGSGAQNNMTEAEQTFVLALQGLANRERPRLYLNVTDENMSYNSSGTAWADWIAKHKQLTFVPQYEGGRAGVCRLAQQLAGPSEGIVKGLVLWDDRLHRHTPPKASECGLPMRTLATTIAGLDSLLPVTLTMLRECACLHRGLCRHCASAVLTPWVDSWRNQPARLSVLTWSARCPLGSSRCSSMPEHHPPPPTTLAPPWLGC